MIRTVPNILQQKTTAQRPVLQYAFLALLFLIAAAYEVRHVNYAVDYILERTAAVSNPGMVNLGSPIIESVTKETEEAGIRNMSRSDPFCSEECLYHGHFFCTKMH